MIAALIGNQNCGKTTLFNALTGGHQRTGNFPGVTVAAKIGKIKERPQWTLVDLPGIYSLSPYSEEEMITRDFLLREDIQVIINIVDAAHLERNLYLSLQLMDLNMPMIIVLNMMDEIEASGSVIHRSMLEERLGIPIAAISAVKNTGFSELLEKLDRVDRAEKKDQHPVYVGEIAKARLKIAALLENKGKFADFFAVKLLEEDPFIRNHLKLPPKTQRQIEELLIQLDETLPFERYETIAMQRYQWIDEISEQCLHIVKKKTSFQIDKILTHPIIGLPLFAISIFFVFWLSFDFVGGTLSSVLSAVLEYLSQSLLDYLTIKQTNPLLISLVIEGIVPGVGSVLSFLPIVVTLFFNLSILEDTGYMARIAMMIDRPMRAIGLSGKSFVPLFIGFGCSVPAIMATRTLPDSQERRKTLLLIPLMSCSAKLPVYALFCAAFFKNHAVYVMMVLYLLGIIFALIFGFIFRTNEEAVPFLLELPDYRLPSVRNLVMLSCEKAKDFISKVLTIIFLSTLLIWFLQRFDVHLDVASHPQDSLLAMIGQMISPVFQPLGLNDWRITAALITGISAKEAILSSLAVLLNSTIGSLAGNLGALFTPLSAFSFLIFVLLYTPCLTALRTMIKETRSFKWGLLLLVLQTGFAWITAAIVYQLGRLLL